MNKKESNCSGRAFLHLMPATLYPGWQICLLRKISSSADGIDCQSTHMRSPLVWRKAPPEFSLSHNNNSVPHAKVARTSVAFPILRLKFSELGCIDARPRSLDIYGSAFSRTHFYKITSQVASKRRVSYIIFIIKKANVRLFYQLLSPKRDGSTFICGVVKCKISFEFFYQNSCENEKSFRW